MQKNRIILTDLLEILSTGIDPLPDKTNPAVMVYEYNDNLVRYDEHDWEKDFTPIFSLGTSMYSAYAYLKHEYAYATVERVWCIPGEPIRIMVIPCEEE